MKLFSKCKKEYANLGFLIFICVFVFFLIVNMAFNGFGYNLTDNEMQVILEQTSIMGILSNLASFLLLEFYSKSLGQKFNIRNVLVSILYPSIAFIILFLIITLAC